MKNLVPSEIKNSLFFVPNSSKTALHNTILRQTLLSSTFFSLEHIAIHYILLLTLPQQILPQSTHLDRFLIKKPPSPAPSLLLIPLFPQHLPASQVPHLDQI